MLAVVRRLAAHVTKVCTSPCVRTLILMHVISQPLNSSSSALHSQHHEFRHWKALHLRFAFSISFGLRSISTCVSTYGFGSLFRLPHTACICHRVCNRESVGFAADRSFSTAFEHCIHRSLSACDRFRFVIQLAIATYDLGLRLGSGLRFRAFRFR
jgi:hypothetical protein